MRGPVGVTGHLQVKGKRGDRAFYYLIRHAEGRWHRKLGPAWVKDSGKRTPKGGPVWVAKDGPKPPGYLSYPEAEDQLKMIMAEAPKTAKPASPVLTLRQACDDWLRWAENGREVKPSTLGDYRNATDRICREFGPDTPLGSLGLRQIQSFITNLKAQRRVSPYEAKHRRANGQTVVTSDITGHVHLTPASTRTRRKYLVYLNGIYKQAIRARHITDNPITLIERPGRTRNRSSLSTSSFLKPDAVQALVRAAGESSKQDAAMFLTAAYCGLRLSELLDLRWPAINFDSNSLQVESSYVRNIQGTPKSGRSRTVPMPPEVARALASLPETPGTDLVFTGRNGGHVDGNALRRRFKATLAQAGLKPIRIHDLRHTFGTVCAGSGIAITTIKEWMGHSDLSTTEIYLAFYPQESDALKISRAFTSNTTPLMAETVTN